jgi:tripartite-type tricarboxylate transporter receptor subunit TctC
MMRVTTAAFAAVILAITAASVDAQNFPLRPIRLIVPFSPGGNVDITARAISGPFGEVLGQQVIVDNRPGATGQIAAELVIKAPADGHTLLMGSSSVMTNAPALYSKLTYDILRDFAPVGRVSVVPLVIVVHPSVPARTTRELVTLAKRQPGKMLMASAGTGTTNHLIAELFMISTGIKMTVVPFKGSGPALIDLMGGHVDAHVDQISSALGYIQAGKIRPIAVTTAKRAALLADVPTLAESGVPKFDASTVTGVLAPAATPREVINKLNGALVQILARPAVKDRFAALGAEVQPSTSDELAAFIREDLATWIKVVKQAGIKVE